MSFQELLAMRASKLSGKSNNQEQEEPRREDEGEWHHHCHQHHEHNHFYQHWHNPPSKTSSLSSSPSSLPSLGGKEENRVQFAQKKNVDEEKGRVHKCKICGKKKASRNGLKMHKKQVHKKPAQEVVTEEKSSGKQNPILLSADCQRNQQETL